MNARSLIHPLFLVVVLLGGSLHAQTPATQTASTSVLATARTNTAIVPVPRPDERAKARTDMVLQRAKANPGACEVAFIGDSITQGWEGAGKKRVAKVLWQPQVPEFWCRRRSHAACPLAVREWAT